MREPAHRIELLATSGQYRAMRIIDPTPNSSRIAAGTLGVLALLVFSAITGQAQAGPEDDPAPLPQIQVTVPKPPTTQELAGESVQNFIAHHARPSAVIGQMARWRTGICPVTLGLSPAFRAYVSARLRAVAEGIGAPVQPENKCDSNVQIIFTTEPQKMLDAVMKRNSRVLGFHHPNQTRALATFNHPIQGWYVTGTRGVSGPEQIDDSMASPGSAPAGQPGSHLSTYRSSVIVNAFIVADTNKLVGYPVGSISDYIAVVVLTMVSSLDNCDPLPSILDLMSATCGDRKKPAAITAGDLAYLKALYQANLELVPSLETSSVLDNMMRQFKGSPP
jgi:hypothetical protein